MKPFRKNLAIAIDGGGIKGVIVTKALSILEEKSGIRLHERAGLTAGTSTGSIIAAGLAAGLEAKTLNELYLELGNEIFHTSLRSLLWPLFNYRYPNKPLKKALEKYLGDGRMAALWKAKQPMDVVITTFDVVESRTCFIKPYKSDYADWPVVKAVLASAAAPTYFPAVEGRYIDGGVGSYGNPCYLAAFEIKFMLGWKPEETTLISIGTGRGPNTIKQGEVNHILPLGYINPILDAFQVSAADQQVGLVEKLFTGLDFRRFQVDLKRSVQMDDPSSIPELTQYGEELGKMMLNDETDRAMGITPKAISGITKSASRRQMNKSGSRNGVQPRKPAKPARARQTR
jgi:hypothetical protein